MRGAESADFSKTYRSHLKRAESMKNKKCQKSLKIPFIIKRYDCDILFNYLSWDDLKNMSRICSQMINWGTKKACDEEG